MSRITEKTTRQCRQWSKYRTGAGKDDVGTGLNFSCFFVNYFSPLIPFSHQRKKRLSPRCALRRDSWEQLTGCFSFHAKLRDKPDTMQGGVGLPLRASLLHVQCADAHMQADVRRNHASRLAAGLLVRANRPNSQSAAQRDLQRRSQIPIYIPDPPAVLRRQFCLGSHARPCQGRRRRLG